jgi:hypothetical protein
MRPYDKSPKAPAAKKAKGAKAAVAKAAAPAEAGSTSQLNLSCLRHCKLLNISALCVPQKVLTSSRTVDKCESLGEGC